MIGPASLDAATGHRCPTIAFTTITQEPSVVAQKLVEQGVQTSSGHYYAVRVLNGIGIDPNAGSFVCRSSTTHHKATSIGLSPHSPRCLADMV